MRALLLCDGGGPIGVGHVIRSLALAEAAVAAGHDVVVAGHFEGSFVQGQLASAPVKVVEISRVPEPSPGQSPDPSPNPLLELVERFDPDVVHIDSYSSSSWLMGSFVLSNMEDGSYGRRRADVVIDPTFGAELAPRPADDSTTTGLLLRGSRYAPIRQRVLDARQVVKPIDTATYSIARSVLVVMGGTDPVGLAPAAVGLLARTGLSLDVTVIAVGEIAERARAAALGSRLSLHVVAPVDDLPALMARQDLVISAAGTSVWELCCLGVPMAVVWAVDNQREGYDRVVGAGAAVGLGGRELGGSERGGDIPGPAEDAVEDAVGRLRTALTDPRVRADLTLAGRLIVDGLGAWRVVRTWEQAVDLGPWPKAVDPDLAAPGLAARPATVQDAQLLWQWRNDPVTRASSRNSEPVPWPEHLAWVVSSLTREDRLLLVLEDETGPAGTVRWDLGQDSGQEGDREWEVSITVAPERRGHSLSRPILRAAEVALSEMTLSEVSRSRATGLTAYLAMVHTDNQASLRLFGSSRYVPDAPPDQKGFMRFRKDARVA
ncbi:MAG: bifunctional UDP-2,4-diacetamido-2,4,6-trideoxy-beta-L-altropyranose hydrolase/GNAT family N-acetyltransferase [Actinomycetota bacterium]